MIEKNKKSVEKIFFDYEKNFKIENLKKFFSENFSDSKILQKKISDDLRKILKKEEEKKKKNFLKSNFLNFLFKIKKIFLEKNPDKKIIFDKIWKNFLEYNLKNFDGILFEIKKIFAEKKDFSELNIFLKSKKKYLEIVNCDLVLDFWGESVVFEITLQSDEFVESVK